MSETDDFFARANRLLQRWETLLDGRATPRIAGVMTVRGCACCR